jgi:1-acyl-sn-glycerol-3-phosphate acyltransferase
VTDLFEDSPSIRVLHAINRLYARAYHHARVHGVVQVPKRGPAMIVSNHVSSLDPLMIQSVVRRPIIWMMASEYYELPVLGRIFRAIRVIPVNRDGRDATALRAALRTLASGHLLGVFPEGRIETSNELLPLQTGPAMIALRTKVPVLPVFQTGSTRRSSMLGALIERQEVSLNFGPPVALNLARPKDFESATQTIANALASLQMSPVTAP